MGAVNRKVFINRTTSIIRDNVKQRLGSDDWKSLSSRTQIISPALCGDVIRRLQPDLPKPGTVDLIDVRPGICLWSRSLHKVLQPRRHILVEPDITVFSQFFDKDEKGVKPRWKYQTSSSLLDALDPENKLLSKETLQEYTENGVRSDERKDLILSINLAAPSNKSSGNGPTLSLAREFAQDLWLSLSGFGSQLYRYGTIKILAWMKDSDRYIYMPRSVDARTKQSIQLELAADIREICSVSPDLGKTPLDRRWYALNCEDHLKVSNQRKSEGVRTCLGRVHPPLQAPSISYAPIPSNFDDMFRDPLLSGELRKFMTLDRSLEELDVSWYNHRHDKAKHRVARNESANKKAWRALIAGARGRYTLYKKAEKIIDEYRVIYKAWVEMQGRSDMSDEQNQEVNDLKARAASVRADLETIRKDENVMSKVVTDDYRAFDAIEPALQWNRRGLEPLACFKEEFLLEEPLTLLEITVKPDIIRILENIDTQIYFRYVLNFLWQRPAADMQSALAELAVDRVEDFIARIPALRDPAQGGWFDLSDLRPRSLPPKMILDIVLAYEKWPYRLSTKAIWNLFGPLTPAWGKKEMR